MTLRPDQPVIVAVDFDDTIAYMHKDLTPGELLPNAKEVLKWMHDHKCYIIIWTCRHDKQLIQAKDFLIKNKIHFDKMNENADFITFTDSPKIYADVYIDDKNYDLYKKVDWLKAKEIVKKLLIEKQAEKTLNIKENE